MVEGINTNVAAASLLSLHGTNYKESEQNYMAADIYVEAAVTAVTIPMI